MEKYYHTELTKSDWEKLRAELFDRGLYFEPSGCGDLVHIAIKCTESEKTDLNKWIDNNL